LADFVIWSYGYRVNTHAERLRDPGQRARRATRILDSAADLLLRHGYRRVTIDDVTAAAGIGKGTVYLHWKSREKLFGAVFARELLRAAGELRDAIRKEPLTCLPHRFAHTYFLAITDRPLLHSFLLGDPELLGRLTSSSGAPRDDRHGLMMRRYFRSLAEHGLLRDDLNADEVGYAYQATFEGFLRAETTPVANGPAKVADLLARTILRAFESDPVISGVTMRDLAAGTVILLDDLIEADRAEFGIPEV
jgi:AcrR family transcriptional regulator